LQRLLSRTSGFQNRLGSGLMIRVDGRSMIGSHLFFFPPLFVVDFSYSRLWFFFFPPPRSYSFRCCLGFRFLFGLKSLYLVTHAHFFDPSHVDRLF
jgi:hypothetical protein